MRDFNNATNEDLVRTLTFLHDVLVDDSKNDEETLAIFNLTLSSFDDDVDETETVNVERIIADETLT